MPAPIFLGDGDGIRIAVSPFGATWLSCVAAGREVLLGSDDVRGMAQGGSYLGSTVGRYAGRIAGACWQGHVLDANQPPHTLHGGSGGFSRRLWQVEDHGARHLVLRLVSAAGDQGFPGTLTATASYALIDAQTVEIRYLAQTDAPTPCNLTNHAYFNLNGGDGDDGLAQDLRIHAASFQPVDRRGIPVGAPHPVAASSFDFRAFKRVAHDWLGDDEQRAQGGYDHSFLLNNHGELAIAAELRAADGRVSLALFTNQPALHLYGGQYLAGTRRRDGGVYDACAGIALESQYPPDSPTRGAAILLPGARYEHIIRYRFDF